MTTPNGPILFNSSTGNDSTASGLGPASAVIGSSAELDGTSTVDVSYDGMDLSGISAGDLLFCDTTSGRKFSIIASVDTINETITTDEAWPIESGVSWAVGGKRATLQNSQHLWIRTDGAGSGLTYELETDQAMSSYVLSYSGMGGTIKSSVTGTKRVITIGGTYFAEGGGWTCYDIHLKSSANQAIGRASTGTQGSSWSFVNCIVGDATDYFARLGDTASRTFAVYGQNTTFQDFNGTLQNNTDVFVARDCVIKNCSRVYYGTSLSSFTCSLFRCVVKNCSSIGHMRRGTNVTLVQNIFDTITNGGQIMSWDDNSTVNVRENVFINMSGYIESYVTDHWAFRRNAFYNATGTWPPPDDSDPITLTADPFIDVANDDYNLNATAGGGAVLRAATMVIGSTTTYPFNWLTNLTPPRTKHPLARI